MPNAFSLSNAEMVFQLKLVAPSTQEDGGASFATAQLRHGNVSLQGLFFLTRFAY